MKITTDSQMVNKGIEIALNDIEINIKDFESGFLSRKSPVLIAGGDYDRPWTRDASINTYNYLAFGKREVAKNTLLSVLEDEENPRIEGQYWDCVIWALGAEQYINVSGDRMFKEIAVTAIKNSLIKLEKEEYSNEYGLFRGAAVYGDGVSAYPDVYGISGYRGCILDWPKNNPDRAGQTGFGIPMHTLSTNCAYYNAYMTLFRLADDRVALNKAAKLRESLSDHFYRDDGLKYIVGKYGDFSEQEGMGVSLGLLTGVLPDDLVDSIVMTDQGIACVWPGYDRYINNGHIGRHSGTIWPFINCFWANEAAKRGRWDIFDFEFIGLLEKVVRDGQFYEIYHPVTGLPYGGVQEGLKDKPFYELKSCEHQAWSATGFLSMLIHGLAGVRVGGDNLTIKPRLPDNISKLEIVGMKYWDTELNIYISKGNKSSGSISIPSSDNGKKNLVFVVDEYPWENRNN